MLSKRSDNEKIWEYAILLMIAFASYSCNTQLAMKETSVYEIHNLTQTLQIDANWDKPQWQNVKAIEISNYMGKIPVFRPITHVKVIYDESNIYVIFNVKDSCVRSVTKTINGPVWEDACVEFFFAPDTSSPERYFNVEINCGGTALMYYNIVPKKNYTILNPDEIRKIEIAHSMPETVDPEIPLQVNWTLEYRLPIEILEKYSKVSRPGKGVIWKANFYKTAGNNSNPHWITWSHINKKKPDFHLPEFFGTIKFQ